MLHNYYSYHQPRSQGLSSSLPLEREGKKRDPGNEVDISQTGRGVVKAIACLENKALYGPLEQNPAGDKTKCSME